MTLIRYCMDKHIRTFCYFFSIQSVYSRILFMFFLFNIVINATVLDLLIKVDTIPGTLIFWLPLMLAQYFVFIVIHLVAVQCSKHLHEPLKVFIRKSVTIQKCKIRDRVDLALFIHKYHTKRKYGLTYGPCGQISAKAFIKVRSREET